MNDAPKSQPPSRYSRLYAKMWADEKFQLLPDVIKLLWVYVLSSPHRNLEGLFRCPLSYIAADLGWNVKHVASRMAVLQREGFVSFDEKTNLILLRNALRYQWPEGTNVVLGVIRRLHSLPSSPLFKEFQTLTRIHCGQIGSAPSARAFAQALERAFGPPVPPPSEPPLELLISESEFESRIQNQQSPSRSRRNGAGRESDCSLSTMRRENQEDPGMSHVKNFMADLHFPTREEGNGHQKATPEGVIELWNSRPSLKHIPKNLRGAASLLDPLRQRCLRYPHLNIWLRLFDAPHLFTPPGNEKPIELRDLVQEETFHMLVAALQQSSYVGK